MAVTSVNLDDTVSTEPPPLQEKGVPSYVAQVLDHLNRLLFSFDMDRRPPARGAPTGSGSMPRANDRDQRRPTGVAPSSHTSSQHLEPLAPAPNVQQPPSSTGHGPNQNMRYPGQLGGLDPYTFAHLAALSALSTPLQPSRPAGNPYMTSADTLAATRQLQALGLLNPLAAAGANNPSTLLNVPQSVPSNQTRSTRAASSDTQPGGQNTLALSPGPHWHLPQSTDALAFTPFPVDPLLLNAHQLSSLHNPSPFSTQTQARSTTQSSPPLRRSTRITSTSTSDSQSAEFLDETAIVEDKRQRNTLASARFRIKKKHRTRMLERSVGELESRSEELEREAAELRRENGWLKEILIMKSHNVRASSETSHARPGLGSIDDADDSSEDSVDEDGEEESARKGGASGTGAKDNTPSSSQTKGKAKET